MLALEGGDPRLLNSDPKGPLGGEESPPYPSYMKPKQRKTYDSSVTFEEYHYYAAKSRAEEDADTSAGGRGIASVLFPSTSATHEKPASQLGEKAEHVNLSYREARAGITDEEWTNASRALRTATASAIFFLITTDILGPFGLPYAFASMGWGYDLLFTCNVTPVG